MFAKVETDPIAEQALATTLRFSVEYDATQPPGKQFAFFDGSGNPHDQLFLIDGARDVEITLGGQDLTFSILEPNRGVNWFIVPGTRPELGSSSSKTRVFSVPEPANKLHPWAFKLVVDTPGVKGILSPMIYLAKAASPQSLTLMYDLASGAFNLQAGGDEEDLISVESQKTLVFTIPSGQSSAITFDLERQATNAPGTIRWAEPAFVWVSGAQPDWVTNPLPDSPSTMLISASGAGKVAGFQFAVKVAVDEEPEITVLSPDPILVNATIGD